MEKSGDLAEGRRCRATHANLMARKRYDLVPEVIRALGVLPAFKDDVQSGSGFLVAEVDVGQIEHVFAWVGQRRDSHA